MIISSKLNCARPDRNSIVPADPLLVSKGYRGRDAGTVSVFPRKTKKENVAQALPEDPPCPPLDMRACESSVCTLPHNSFLRMKP